MRVTTRRYLHSARAVQPYLWGFAAAAALDHVIDVQSLFLPALAGVLALGATALLLRRPGQ